MKKNNKGFTLIELLAIIVILAIIAVITVPIILNIIENSRKGAASDSALGYKDSVNKTYVAELQNHNKLKLDGTYTVNSDGSLTPADENTDFNEENYDSLDVQVSGTIPSSGKLRYSNNVLNAGCVVIGDYKVTFGTDGKVNGTVKGNCSEYVFPSDVEDDGEEETPVAENWDTYYVPFGGGQTTAFSDSWAFWGQENTTSKQVCGRLPQGIICLESKQWNKDCYEDEDSDTICPTLQNIQSQIESEDVSCNLSNSELYCYTDSDDIDDLYIALANGDEVIFSDAEYSDGEFYCKISSGNISCR